MLENTTEGQIQNVIADLQDAWNASDGARFAKRFAVDADFVNVYGMYARGRQAIAQGHGAIFRTVYADSVMVYTLAKIRLLRADVAVVHLRARLSVPRGPLAGELEALPSMVLTRDNGEWAISAFHNTFIQPPQTVVAKSVEQVTAFAYRS